MCWLCCPHVTFFIDSDNRLLSNILFVVRAIDGARGPGDLGFARTVSRHPVDVGFETTETKCRREAETRSRSAGEWLLFAPTTKKDILSDILFVVRAIDGARTRGLDLGKVARYQLRHYRICNYVLSNTSSILTDVPRNVNLILNNFCIYLNNSKNYKSGMKPATAA